VLDGVLQGRMTINNATVNNADDVDKTAFHISGYLFTAIQLSTSAVVTPSSCHTTIGDRAFFVAAQRAWNTLPSSVTASETLGTF